MESEISNSNNDDSITVEAQPSNTITPDNLTKEFQDIMSLLIDDNNPL